MGQALEKKSSKILIVDSSASGRQLVSDVVRGFGFLNIDVLGSGKDVLSYLEQETPDWILMPLMATQPVNALHVLKILTQHKRLVRIRTSLLVDAAEEYCLPLAYDLGLLSHHPRSYFREALHESLEILFNVLKSNNWNACLSAACYLRMHLAKQ